MDDLAEYGIRFTFLRGDRSEFPRQDHPLSGIPRRPSESVCVAHLMPGGERLPRDSTPHSSPLLVREPISHAVSYFNFTLPNLLPCFAQPTCVTDGRESRLVAL
jgi:hypothetical protein